MRCCTHPWVIDAAKLWCARFVRHPGTRRVRSRRAGSRILLPRLSLAGIASVVLALAAFAAPAGAKVFEPGGQARGRALPAAPASGSGWSVTPSPNPRAGNGSPNAVSCPTTSVCTAVGLHVRESGLGVTLAERRSGGSWTVQPTPNPPGAAASALNGVSCPSGSACTGVGQFTAGSGAQLTLAERWNGSKWMIQPTPNPAGSSSSRLSAVACPAADSCTAVGASNSKLLVERWGGARWRIQFVPIPPGAQFSELNGVTCNATTSCLAVGDYVNSSRLDVTLAERWNGTNWAIQLSPNPTGTRFFSVLTGVSCTAPNTCEASGAWDAGLFAERWNGTSWSLQAVPAPSGAQVAQLFGMACAASSCEAVGIYQNRSGAFVPLGERWNGAAWRAQPTPDPARASTNFLSGVSCPSSSDCTAVGQGNGDGTAFALGERWRDGRWNLENVRSPVGAAENQLNGIACPAPDACVAVGMVGPTRGVLSTEALGWNGRTWHLQRIPTLPGASLNAVSCASETDCVAVGGSNSGTLAEHWNGKHWMVQPTPNPSAAPAPALTGVSCTAATSCIAVGASFDTSGGLPTGTFAERWNGTGWKLQRTPTQHTAGGILVGVWCTSPAACIATGSTNAGTLAERLSGTTWKIQRTPFQRTPGSFLASVWCASPAACIAAGGTNAGTLAERLSGTVWTVLPTPNLPGTQGDSFNSVSCTSLSACTGAGWANVGSSPAPNQTLAERWNGTRWLIQPTPLLPGISLLNNFSAVCPAPSACIAAGGFENDGPVNKTLTEQWRATGTAATLTAPGASSLRAHRGIAGCIRAAIGEGAAIGAAASRLRPTINARMLHLPQPASEIEQIASLCSAA